jgi:hypothetical protein
MKNCTSCKMQHHLILRFPLVCGLTKVFLVGGLGADEQQHSLRKAPIFLHVICGCGVEPQWKSSDQNEEHLVIWTNKFEILLPLTVLLDFLRKSSDSVYCMLHYIVVYGLLTK